MFVLWALSLLLKWLEYTQNLFVFSIISLICDRKVTKVHFIIHLKFYVT